MTESPLARDLHTRRPLAVAIAHRMLKRRTVEPASEWLARLGILAVAQNFLTHEQHAEMKRVYFEGQARAD